MNKSYFLKKKIMGGEFGGGNIEKLLFMHTVINPIMNSILFVGF